MDVVIRKGERTGRALVPCAIYTLSHQIDLNPSLVVKSTGETRDVPLGKVSFDPEREELKLNKGEEIRWQEEERCPSCKRKIVIAEVSETRYRSCPEIAVSLSDPAPNDIKIPAKFGIRIKEIRDRFLTTIGVDAGIGLIVCLIYYNPPTYSLNPYSVVQLICLISLGILSISPLPILNYQSYKLWQWWRSVKATLRPISRNQGVSRS